MALDGVRSAIHLDTVGRLGEGKIQVIATGTATEWPHLFRGVGFVTGIEFEAVREALESSDQTSFIDEGIPAVQLFTGPQEDDHRSTDTADRVDAAGLVKVATFLKESVAYLASLRDFSNLLKSLQPGQTVTARWSRDGEEREAEVELLAR